MPLVARRSPPVCISVGIHEDEEAKFVLIISGPRTMPFFLA